MLPVVVEHDRRGAQAPKPDDLDRLLAPIALYPDALLAQMLLCAANPAKVGALNEWMAANPTLKGSDLQDAATKSGFDQSFAALVLFPDVVETMASQIEWTTRLGRGVRGRPLGGLREHPAPAQEGQSGGEAEERRRSRRSRPRRRRAVNR